MNVDKSVKMSLKLEKLKLPEMVTGRSEWVWKVPRTFQSPLETKLYIKYPPFSNPSGGQNERMSWILDQICKSMKNVKKWVRNSKNLKLSEIVTGRSEQVRNVSTDFLQCLDTKLGDKWPPSAIPVEAKTSEWAGFLTKNKNI